jgi:hypothetical protein
MRKWMMLVILSAMTVSCSVRGETRNEIYDTMERLISYSMTDSFEEAAPLIVSFGGDTNIVTTTTLDYSIEPDRQMTQFVCSMIKTLVLTHDSYQFGKIDMKTDGQSIRYHLTVYFFKNGEKKSADFSFVYDEGKAGLVNFTIN